MAEGGQDDITAPDLLSLLPDELLTHILLYLTPGELCLLCRASRAWHALVTSCGVWLKLCKREGFVTGRRKQEGGGRNYKELYSRLWRRLAGVHRAIVPLTIATSQKRFRAVCYNDGKITAVGEKGKVQQWDAGSGRRLHVLHVRADPTGFRVAEDVLVVGYEDGPIQTWHVPSGRLLREYSGHAGRVEAIDISVARDRMLFASADRHIRLWSVSQGTLLHVFTDTNTDCRFLGAGLCFPPEPEVDANDTESSDDGRPAGRSGDDAYFVLWSTSHQIHVTKLSLCDDAVLGRETLDLRVSVEYCQGLKVVGVTLCSLVCLQDAPNFMLARRLCFSTEGGRRALCFDPARGEERYACGHRSYISSFTCGATYQVCFPLTLDRDRGRPTGFPPLYDAVHVYRLQRPLVPHAPPSHVMCAETILRIKTLQPDVVDAEVNLLQKVKRLVLRSPAGHANSRSKVTYADLGDRRWLDGLDGENDRGPFLVTVEYWTDPPRFHIIVYNWLEPGS